jgi:hypothetical protein
VVCFACDHRIAATHDDDYEEQRASQVAAETEKAEAFWEQDADAGEAAAIAAKKTRFEERKQERDGAQQRTAAEQNSLAAPYLTLVSLERKRKEKQQEEHKLAEGAVRWVEARSEQEQARVSAFHDAASDVCGAETGCDSCRVVART